MVLVIEEMLLREKYYEFRFSLQNVTQFMQNDNLVRSTQYSDINSSDETNQIQVVGFTLELN